MKARKASEQSWSTASGHPIEIPGRAAGTTPKVPLERQPDWTILAHLKRAKCGSVDWVDPWPNWCEVVDHCLS
ncbi:hypothetical protein ACFIOY_23090 [Bradyrhizobium sp. TZ2]